MGQPPNIVVWILAHGLAVQSKGRRALTAKSARRKVRVANIREQTRWCFTTAPAGFGSLWFTIAIWLTRNMPSNMNGGEAAKR